MIWLQSEGRYIMFFNHVFGSHIYLEVRAFVDLCSQEEDIFLCLTDKHFPWCGGGVAKSQVRHCTVFLHPTPCCFPSRPYPDLLGINALSDSVCCGQMRGLKVERKAERWDGRKCCLDWLVAVPAVPRWAVNAATCLSSLSHTHMHHVLLGWDWLQNCQQFYKKNI